MSSKQSIQDIFQTAQARHQAGRLPHAEALYQQVLQVRTGHPDTLHLLGMIARQTNKLDSAFALISQAITARPSEAAFHNFGGKMLYNGSQLAVALRT